MPEQTFRHDLELNLLTAFHVTQAALPGMLERGYGRIVMVSSVTGPLVTTPGSVGYSTAKAAMDGMMRSLAHDSGRSGVTANSVQPGWIATGSATPQEIIAGASTPVGRPGRAARGRGRGRLPGLRGGQLHHGADARRGRREHHPGSARRRRLLLSGERPPEPGVHRRSHPLDILGIVEVVADARELVAVDALAGGRARSGRADPARRPHRRTGAAAGARRPGRAGRGSAARSATARGAPGRRRPREPRRTPSPRPSRAIVSPREGPLRPASSAPRPPVSTTGRA